MTILLTTNARNRFRQIYDYYKSLGQGKGLSYKKRLYSKAVQKVKNH